MWFVLPGIASNLPWSAGIHQLWSTSSETMSSRIARRAGTFSVFTWTTPFE
jgi:hypothetical protein